MESLYTKYRPQTFADVVGQGHVTSTLERAVVEGRVSHAYLFCGPRGTGKTTMARLLAKALLCQRGPGQLPDGTCEDCELVAAGEHPDVYELDAASRTGVDNVREEIINNVGYAPVRGRYKVYIIDEVHMLTPAAFNALLKTLEEPPAHVVFVMCTTDPQKILATVLSRVQRFDFHAISDEDLVARLGYVCEQEGFTYEQDALELVARHARGGLRDALSTLEQLSVFGDGTVSVAAARDMLGALSGQQLSRACRAIAERDVPALFSTVAELVDGGHDLLRFVRQLAARVRDAYVMSVAGEVPGAFAETGEDLEALRAEVAAFGSADRLARVLTVLGDASNEMRVATNQRLSLEVALTRLARPETDLTLEALAERVAELEAQVRALAVHGVARPSRQGSSERAAAEPAPAAVASSAPAPAAAVAQPAANPVAAAAPAQPAAPSAATPVRRPAASAPAAAPSHGSAPAPREHASAQTAPAPQAAPSAQAGAPEAAPSTPQATRAAAPAPTAAPRAAARPAVPAPVAPADPGALQRKWRQVMEGLLQREPSRGSLLMSSTIVGDDGEVVTVSLPKGSSFALRMLERPDVRSALDPQVEAVFGPRRTVFVEGGAAPAAAARPAPAAAPTRPAAPTQAAARPVPAPPAAPPVPAAVPATAPAAPAAPVPAPADPVPYEAVPYDDADAAYYDEEAGAPAMPPVPASAAASEPSAPATPAPARPQVATRPPAPAPAAPAAPQPATTSRVATPPAPEQAPEEPPASGDASAALPFFSPETALTDGKVPEDLIRMLEGAFDGEVRVSVIPAAGQDAGPTADEAEAAAEALAGASGYDGATEEGPCTQAGQGEYADDPDAAEADPDED